MEPIGLFADRALTLAIPKVRRGREEYWYINFGHLDAGQRRVFQVFIENQSLGDIEDLEIKVLPLGKKGVEVSVQDGLIPRLDVNDIREFRITWEVSEQVKAGECVANLSIKGVITKE